MPVADLQDASDLDRALQRVLAAPDLAGATRHLRDLFTARLDFDAATGTIALRDKELPATATRIAHRGGVHVVLVALPAPRHII